MSSINKFYKILIISVFMTIFIWAENINAQIGGAVIGRNPEYRNTAGFNINAGPFLQRDAYFIGFAIDYSRLIAGPWAFAVSIAYDKETDKSKKTDIITQSWTLIGSINYSIDKFTFATGFGKGFANTSNPENRMKFDNGDWATGLAISYALPNLPWYDQDNISIGSAFEYNITNKEWDLSFDLGFGWSF